MLPPPLARSPIKTALGSSPRRQSSTGPRFQARRLTSTPDRASPYPAVSRRLNFSVTEQDSDIEQETPAATNGLDTRNRGKGRADVYDLEVSPVRGQKRTYDESIVEEEISANGDSETGINGGHDETLLPPVEDESLQFVHGDNDTSAGSYEEDSLALPEATPQPKKRLRTRRSNMIDSSQVQEEPSVAKPTRASNRGRGRGRGGVRPGSGRPSRSGKALVFASNERGPSPIVQPKQKVPAKRTARSRNKAPEPSTEDEEESVVEQEPTADEESIIYEPPAAKAKGRRRSAGSKNVPVHKNKPSADKEEPVFKAQEKISKPKANPKSKPPPSERDPNAKIESAKKSSIPVVDPVRSPSKAASEGASVTSTAPKRPGVGRSLQILRQGTPMEDSGVRTTRFGRASVKPVDWWRNERIKYDPHGNKQAIVRAEEVEVPKLAKRAHKQRKREMSVVEEDEEELEDWEIEPGILTGLVTGWDEEVGVAMQDEEEQGMKSESWLSNPLSLCAYGENRSCVRPVRHRRSPGA
jgi:centromere protein C